MSDERPKGIVGHAPAGQARGSLKRATILAVGSLLPLLLTACAFDGDLGRPRDTTLVSTLTEPLRLLADITNHPVHGSDFRLTPDETTLRETSYRLRAQIHNLRPMRWTRYSEVAYAENLQRAGHTFGPSRLTLIHQELEADDQALNRFAEFARRVFDADQRRMDAVVTDRAYYTVADKRNARSRMRQNCAVIEGTFKDLAFRIEAYEYAIDRARIETPDVSVTVVNGSLDNLRDRAVSLHYELIEAYKALKGPRNSRRRAARALYGNSDRPVDIRPPQGRKRTPDKVDKNQPYK